MICFVKFKYRVFLSFPINLRSINSVIFLDPEIVLSAIALKRL